MVAWAERSGRLSVMPRHRLAVDDLRGAVGFLGGLPGLLRRPVSLPEARATQRAWLQARERAFLSQARHAIYGYAPSPYRRLLGLAGCELGDLERLVTLEGLEGALCQLYRRGVFLTIDELKGRRPVRRGSATFDLDPRLLRNPCLTGHLLTQTGGSRGRATEVPVDLRAIRERAVTLRLWLNALGELDWRVGHWGPPGGGTLGNVLEYLSVGVEVSGWFWRVDPATAGLHPRFRWSARALRLGAGLARARLVPPRYVPMHAARPVIDWLSAELRDGHGPLLVVTPSYAVELCRQAEEQGRDLRGARLVLVSEPCTAARRAAIERVGALPLPRYASTELRPIGYGCLRPVAPDETHVVAEQVALIQAGSVTGQADAEPRLPARATLLTSLRATAPLLLLNASLGDEARVEQRSCGCPLEALGWTLHLREIRSFEKLSTAGMTFLDTDIVPILEAILPARFGGGPTDYQLVEQEGEDGRPSLRLLVHPRVGPLDAGAVTEAFLDALGAGSDARQVMALEWRAAGLPEVVRQETLQTEAGKILHLHVAGAGAAARAEDRRGGRNPAS